MPYPDWKKKRLNENKTLFSQIARDFGREDSDIYRQNDCHHLTGEVFANGVLPIGYHDALVDGVLLVRDMFTDKLIRKDQAQVTTKGEFFPLSYPFIILGTPYPADLKHKLYLAACGNVEAKLDLQKYIFLRDDYGVSYSLFADMYLYRKSVKVASRLRDMYSRFRAATGTPMGIESTDLISFDVLQSFLNSFLANMNSEEYTPAIVACRNPDNDLRLHRINEGIYLEISQYASSIIDRPIYILNHNDVPVYWSAEELRSTSSVQILSLPSSQYFFDIAFFTTAAQSMQTSRQTRNNEGYLLSYSTKVNTLKASFKMLPEEKTVFDAFDKKYKQKKKLNPSTKKIAEEQPIFLGLELEAIARAEHQLPQKFQALISDIANSQFGDHVIMKADSSLHSDYGLEIVTIPATLAYHKKIFEETFFSKENAFHKRIMANDYCGIHVHISKNALTTLKWGQFMHFMNAPENEAFINAMANRTQNLYCRNQPVAGCNPHGINVSAKIVARACINGRVKQGLRNDSSGDDRRVAVNHTNKDTIEIRRFKSSNDKHNILRKLEFCEALVHFVRRHSPQQMNVYEFVNFILTSVNKKDYPHIVKWLASKNYIGHKRIKIKDKNILAHIYGQNQIPKPNTWFYKQKETK